MNLSNNQKLSFSISELYSKIEEAGFETTRCKYDKKRDRFQATAKNESGIELEAFGPNERYALTNLLHNVVHHNSRKSRKIARWKTTFENQVKEIAEAYAKAPQYERKAANAFVELGHECRTKANAIKKQIAINLTNNPVPYTDPEKMFDDIRKRRKLEVSKADTEHHPIWSREDVINFRICMDVLGHAAAHAGYDWEGLNQAFATFAALLPELAQDALFTEVIGQGAHATYYRSYGPAKICLLKKFLAEAQQTENPHKNYRGVHPSQLLIPHDVPEAKVSKKLETKDGIVPFDINDGWVSPYENYPQMNYLLDYPDFMNIRDAGDKLEKLHTDWADNIHDHSDEAHVREEWRMYKVDDPEGALHIKQAVGNALKAAILMKDHGTGHAAIQYQDVFDKNSSDPEDYWKQLEGKRTEWNASRFGGQSANDHLPWLKMDEKGGFPLMALASRISEHDHDHPEKSISNAHRTIHEMHTRIHKKIKDNAPPVEDDKDIKNWATEGEATKQVMRYLDMILDGGGKFDHWTHESAKKVDPIKPHKFDKSFKELDNHKIFNLQRYPSVHGDHLQLIAKLMKNLDQITEEALVDVHNHDGKGHHFRAYVMSLEEIDPKIIGTAWLLLQPLSSQLSMISEDMQGALSHHGSGQAPRDYFLHERSLMAHRDGMGLEHIPLGHFNYALNGTKSGSHVASGGATHQDLSAFKVKDPEAAWRVPLVPEGQPAYALNLTKGIEKPIEEEWNKGVAAKFAPDEIPHKSVRPFAQFTSAYDYQGLHTAPGPTYGVQLHNDQELGTNWMPDYYEHPEYYYHDRTNPTYDKESEAAIKQHRAQPDSMATIYRAGPKPEINQGDWVTLSPEYAKAHALGNVPEDDTPVWTTQVPAHTLWTGGDSHNEWGYHGPSTTGQRFANQHFAAPDPLYNFLGRIGPQYEALFPFIHYLYNSGNAQPLADGNFQFRMPGQEDWKDLGSMLPNLLTVYKSSPQMRNQIDQWSSQPIDPKSQPLKPQDVSVPPVAVAPKPDFVKSPTPPIEAPTEKLPVQEPDREPEEYEPMSVNDALKGWTFKDVVPNPVSDGKTLTNPSDWASKDIIDPNDDVEWDTPTEDSDWNKYWDQVDNKTELESEPYKPTPEQTEWTNSPIQKNFNRTVAPSTTINYKMPDGMGYQSGWSFDSGFETVVDQFAPSGLSCLYDETPIEVNISHVEVANKNQGIGSQFMQAAQQYCEQNGKQLVVSRVDNQNFFSKFPFLTQTDDKTFQGLTPSAV